MKKIKKLSKGMTLVEVIVAMTIFALASACIMSVVGAAMKMSNRSRRRDLETAQQANAVGKKSDQETAIIGSMKDYTITFTPVGGGSAKTVNDISLYAADAAQFGADFGFQIKTFGKGSLNSLSTTIDPSMGNEYKFEIQNNLSESVTAYVTINEGYVFEGDNSNSGYKHSSKSYARTIATGNSADFGYCNVSYDFQTDIEIRFVTQSNVTVAASVNPLSITTNKTVSFELDNVSGSAKCSVSYS